MALSLAGTNLGNLMGVPTSTNPLGQKAVDPNAGIKKPTTALASNQVAPSPPPPTYNYNQYSISQNPNPTTGGRDIYLNGVRQSYEQMSPLFSKEFDTSQIKNIYTPPAQNSTPVTPVSSANPTTSTTPTYTANNGLYGQLIAGLANTASQPSQDYTSIIKSLIDKTNAPSADYLATKAKAEEYNKQIGDINANYAKQTSNIEGSPIDLSLATGQQGILNRLMASKSAALAGQFQGETNLMNAANTAQANQLSGLSSAGGIANTQRQLEQSGLASAGGMAAPQLGQYGQPYYSPVTGGAVGGTNSGGSLNPLNNIASIAQQVISGQISPSQGYAMGGTVPNFQGALNQEIQKQSPGFDTAVAEGNYSATESVTAGQSQTIAGWTSALQQGQNLQNQLNDLIANFKLNPSDINMVNAGLQKIAQNISSPEYKMLNNWINEVANTYSQVLTPPNGTVTDTSRGIASSMLDATMKGESLKSVIQGLDIAARAKIEGVRTNPSTYSVSGNTSGSTSAGGYNFKQVNGQWVPA